MDTYIPKRYGFQCGNSGFIAKIKQKIFQNQPNEYERENTIFMMTHCACFILYSIDILIKKFLHVTIVQWFLYLYSLNKHSHRYSIEVLRIHNEVVKVNVAQNPQPHAAKLDDYTENLCAKNEDG